MSQFNSIEDEIAYIEKSLYKIDSDIKSLWDNIMLPYIENYNQNRILMKLTLNNYNVFYTYMINNSDTYFDLVNRLEYLKN